MELQSKGKRKKTWRDKLKLVAKKEANHTEKFSQMKRIETNLEKPLIKIIPKENTRTNFHSLKFYLPYGTRLELSPHYLDIDYYEFQRLGTFRFP